MRSLAAVVQQHRRATGAAAPLPERVRRRRVPSASNAADVAPSPAREPRARPRGTERGDLEGSLEEVERLARLVDASARAGARGCSRRPRPATVELSELVTERVGHGRRGPTTSASGLSTRGAGGGVVHRLAGRAAPGGGQPGRERARGLAGRRHRHGQRLGERASSPRRGARALRPSSESARSTASGAPGPVRDRASASPSCGGLSRPTAATWSWSRLPAAVSRPSSGSARRGGRIATPPGRLSAQRAKRSTWSWREGTATSRRLGTIRSTSPGGPQT